VQPSIEQLDLAQLAIVLRRRFGRHLFAGYLNGKTLMRDALEELLSCSDSMAEELVETLELQGYLRFPHLADDTHPATRQSWIIGANT
jgi:hypothetical protein